MTTQRGQRSKRQGPAARRSSAAAAGAAGRPLLPPVLQRHSPPTQVALQGAIMVDIERAGSACSGVVCGLRGHHWLAAVRVVAGHWLKGRRLGQAAPPLSCCREAQQRQRAPRPAQACSPSLSAGRSQGCSAVA